MHEALGPAFFLLVLTAWLDCWHILKRLADIRRSSLFQHFAGNPLDLTGDSFCGYGVALSVVTVAAADIGERRRLAGCVSSEAV